MSPGTDDVDGIGGEWTDEREIRIERENHQTLVAVENLNVSIVVAVDHAAPGDALADDLAAAVRETADALAQLPEPDELLERELITDGGSDRGPFGEPVDAPDHVKVYDVVVRDGPRGHDLGVRYRSGFGDDVDELTIRGFGELTSAAHDEIEETVALTEHEPGTRLATVEIDVDEWAYRIEWHVPTGSRWSIIPGVGGGLFG